MTQVIIDGDACPVTNSVVELTKGQASLLLSEALVIFLQKCNLITSMSFMLMMADAVDYKIVKITRSEDIVITQDYGLASLLLNKAKVVMHHKGFIFDQNNINTLLEQRHASAQFRKSGGRTKGPSSFTTDDIAIFEQKFLSIINDVSLFTEE